MRDKKAASELAVGDTLQLPAGDGIVSVHSVRSILRVRYGGMTISVQADGRGWGFNVPLPEADMIQFCNALGRVITLPGSQVVDVL